MPTRKRPRRKSPKGVPSLDDPAVVAELCRRITEGQGVYKVCEATDMPGVKTVYRRMAEDELFAAQISRARELGQDAITDLMAKEAENATAETWQVARLRIWTHQWLAAKLRPKKYGDKTHHEHTGADGGAIPVRFEALSDGQLGSFIQRLEHPTERGDEAEVAGPGEGGAGETPPGADE